MTVLEGLQSTTGYFKKRGIDSPRLNAEHLFAHTLGCQRIDLYLQFERALSERELAPLRDLLKRRGNGEPLQHLIGTVEFCGHVFSCDKRALIPRPETEQLVELVIQINGSRQPLRILDVGTGSGVIALSLAVRFPLAKVLGVDISEEALALAQENAGRLGLARVRFGKSDLVQNVEGGFDLIVANLPYIAETERQSLSREVLHDPVLALFAGEQGDRLIRNLIIAAPPRLEPDGLLALEIGFDQAGPLTALLSEKNYHDIVAKNDYSGGTRFLFARYG
jgi:release factor glutamine methyltransferase